MLELAIVSPVLVFCLACIVNLSLVQTAKHDALNGSRCATWMLSKNPDYKLSELKTHLQQHCFKSGTKFKVSHYDQPNVFESLDGISDGSSTFGKMKKWVNLVGDLVNSTQGIQVSITTDLLYWESVERSAWHKLSSNAWSFDDVFKRLFKKVLGDVW